MSTVLDTLVYDRTQNDIVELKNIRRKIATKTNTYDDLSKWTAGMKGALNYKDLNRIGNCLAYMQTWLSSNGVSVTITARNDWTLGELVTSTDLDKIKNDILTIANEIGYPFEDLSNNIYDYYGKKSTDINPNEFSYLQYNFIEKTIRYFMPTALFSYAGSNEVFMVQWTPDDYWKDFYSMLLYNLYPAKNIEKVCINGYGITNYMTNILNDTRLDTLKEVRINIAGTINGYLFGKNVEKVVIDGKLTKTIPNGFFAAKGGTFGDYTLKEIKILDGVTSIGDNAFRYCFAVNKISIADSVLSIGKRAFSLCYGLTKIELGNGIISADDYAFYDCHSVNTIVLGNSIQTIGEYAFYGCELVTSIELPNSITSIGDYAFSGNVYINNITYDGTMAEWALVTKGTDWARDAQTSVVHCSDGDVAI